MTITLHRVMSGSTDIQSILKLEHEAFGEGAMSIWAIEPFCTHGRCFLFRLDEEIVAEALFLPSWGKPESAYFFSFAVSAHFQKQGIGREALPLALEALRRDGIKIVELTVSSKNKAAMALYKGVGFRQVTFRKALYGDNEDRCVLIADLTETLNI